MKTKIHKLKLFREIPYLIVALVMLFGLIPVPATAAMNTMYLAMTSTTPGASSTTWTLHFRPSVTTGIRQMELRVCTAPGAWGTACTVPTGLVFPASNGVTLTGFGDTVVTSANYSSPTETIVKTTATAENTGTDHQVAIATVTNPNAGVFYVRARTYSDLGTTVIDESTTASASIAQVALSGNQRESLTVTVAGANNTSICDATTQNLTANDATHVYFNDFNGATAINSGQSITVSTNAASGYNAQVYADHGLRSGSIYINDAPQIADLSQGTVHTTWSAYTGLGVCASGGDANTTMYGTGANWYYHAIANGASSVTKTVASNAGVTSNVTTNVNFKVNVSSAMAAGTYTNNVNYWVGPRF